MATVSFPTSTTQLSAACPEVPMELIERVAKSVNMAYGELIATSGAYEAGAMWTKLHTSVLTPQIPFSVHKALYHASYADWDWIHGPAPAWYPNDGQEGAKHIEQLMHESGVDGYSALHSWSCKHRAEFWGNMISKLGIEYDADDHTPGDNMVLAGDAENPEWLPGAMMNIADSCFNGPLESVAVVYGQGDCGTLSHLTVDQLKRLSARVANSLVDHGCQPGDAIAIDMPMTIESVYIYLGIVLAGCVVVSIADSFAAEEIATRLRLSDAKLVFTQDSIARAGKRLALYTRVVKAAESVHDPAIVVIPQDEQVGISEQLRDQDRAWSSFLSSDDQFDSVKRAPAEFMNILFSSGTTGDPKAIPWHHTTPIKCGVDAYLHMDVSPGEVVCWPTNLGWMMGPFLIFAALMNKASIALYYDAPQYKTFGYFVEKAKVTMLGLVPSMAKSWRAEYEKSGTVHDWSTVRCFASTGEASAPEDYLWLFSRVQGYRPVIEYCGGTEIGGGFITGTLIQPQAPAAFSTPALGIDLEILDLSSTPLESGEGELVLVPPSIGLSVQLLNRDHHTVYYKDMPMGAHGQVLRRHGDQMHKFKNGYFRACGRCDDTMNVSGIKVSSAELERVCDQVPGVKETAAIAVPPPDGGPDELVFYCVLKEPAGLLIDPSQLKKALQEEIKQKLNPLFRVAKAHIVDALPRTASNKVMRRILRQNSLSSGNLAAQAAMAAAAEANASPTPAEGEASTSQHPAVCVVGAVRTPIGAFNGALASLSSTDLGAHAIRAAVQQAGLDPVLVQECFMGNVYSANLGQAPARQAALKAGLPESCVCTTLNKVCASGAKAISLGAQSILLGDADIVVAGGMESMSNVPYMLPNARFGMRMGDGQLVDGMIKDGLWDPTEDLHMGNCAEQCATAQAISREAQDDYAVESYRRAQEAFAKGKLEPEIAPIQLAGRRGCAPETVSQDEQITKLNELKLRKLKPAFDKHAGTVTAGNSSSLADLSLIHISEPTRLLSISYAVFCLKKKKKKQQITMSSTNII
eukprot:TRINITY_DN1188_c0_g2_i3.p1 TRINITY_DN1188_c0_g2~~TRINITY_DN1188_c0_g2_i3.p1  ORF type:complete len:1032 (+),score=217.90 TRINITY_DN1188_c0_g2_i3:212-3307(+)